MQTDINISKYYLNKTFLYLHQYEKVILVSTPIDNEILEIENKLWNHFYAEIETFSKNTKNEYPNFSTKNWSNYYWFPIYEFGGSYLQNVLAKLI